MAFTSNGPALEIRFAFERDMVRNKGIRAFRKHGIIGLCEVCGEDFDRIRGNQKYCKTCKVEVRRDQVRRDVRKHRDLHPPETESQKNITQEKVLTPDPYTNLMLALCQSAADDNDTEWLEENKEVYTQAILGRRTY